jgi:7-cyano-7-deazaguanine synthase
MQVDEIKEVKQKIVVISLSGGMDSTSLLLHELNEGLDVYAISFDYGQKHKIELERVKAVIAYLNGYGYNIKHTIIDLSILGKMFRSALTSDDIEIPEGHYAEDNMKATVVPNRNAIFSSIAYGYALSLAEQFKTKAYIALGIHAGDHDIYPDCRQEFRDALEVAFKLGNWGSENVSYDTPYINTDKTGILSDAWQCLANLIFGEERQDFNQEEFGKVWNFIYANTNTCYNPDKEGRSCGKCGSCQERLLAFHMMSLIDPVPYQSDINEVTKAALENEAKFQEEHEK